MLRVGGAPYEQLIRMYLQHKEKRGRVEIADNIGQHTYRLLKLGLVKNSEFHEAYASPRCVLTEKGIELAAELLKKTKTSAQV